MAVLNNTGILMGSSAVTAAAGDYQIGKSLRFNDDDSAYLSRKVKDSNRLQWTWAGWFKRGKVGGGGFDIASSWADDNWWTAIRFGDDFIEFSQKIDGADGGGGDTDEPYRDPSAWMHVCIVCKNNTNNPSNDRQRLFVNGKFTSLSGVLGSNIQGMINKEGTWRMGSFRGTDNYFDGYMADVNFLDGVDIGPACFGKFDSTGLWVPTAINFPAINNGTTWSGSGFSGDAIDSSYPAANLFDGLVGNNQNYGTQFQSNANEATIHWAPSGGIKYNQGIRVNLKYNGTCSINDGEHVVDTDGSGGFDWLTIVNGSGTLEKITFTSTDNSQKVRLEGIEIDGQILIDGKTDCTWDEWKALNDNTDLWSNHVTGTLYSSEVLKSTMFDGAWRNGTTYPSEGNTLQFKPPTTITASSQIRVYMFINGSANTDTDNFKVNGTSQFNAALSAIGTGNTNWYTLSGTTIDSTNGLEWKRTSGGSQVQMCAIEVDGVLLTNSMNSFSLKFDDNSLDRYLGKDTLHGKLEDATGGLPIYNTTDDYGDVKGSGYRSDSDSADLILALPFDSSMTTDVSASVHGSGTNKTFTKGGGFDCNAKQSRFYGTAWDNPNSTSQNYAQPSLYMAAHADWDSIGTDDFTIECWLNKPSGQSGNDYWIDNSGLKLYFSNSSGSGLNLSDGVSASAWILDASDFVYDQWYHLAIVRTSGSVKTYINGRLKKTVSFTADLGNNATMFVGQHAASDAAHFQGHMQDLRIYTKAKYSSEFTVPYRNDWTVNNLSAAGALLPLDTSVANATGALPIYNTTGTYGGTKGSGNRTDGTSNPYLWVPMDGANNGTTINDVRSSSRTVTIQGDVKTVTDESKFYGSCGYFDGSGDYLECADSDDWKPNGEFTIEGWFKFAHLNDTQHESLIAQAMTGNDNVAFDLNRRKSNDGSNPGKIQFAMNNSSGGWQYLYSNSALNDLQWHHIAVSIKSDIAKMYIDGVEQTDSFEHATGTGHNAVSAKLTIGAQEYNSGRYPFQGWMQDIRIYGAGKYTQSFTVPNDPGVSTKPDEKDSLTDSPTNYGDEDTGVGGELRGNYPTWNPLDADDASTLSQGNLTYINDGSTWNGVRATFAIPAGKWYWEYTQKGADGCSYGIASRETPLNDHVGGTGSTPAHTWGGANWYQNGSGTATGLAAMAEGDVIGVAYDTANGKLHFSRNGQWYGASWATKTAAQVAAGTDPVTSSVQTDTEFFPAHSNYSTGRGCSVNFGQRAFKYTAPSGFKCLCSQNLPDTFSGDELNNCGKFFDIVTFTGSASNGREVKGFNFGPDLVWGKQRNGSSNHAVFDVIRGATKRLVSNATQAEDTQANQLTAFNSDGFTYNNDLPNQSGNTAVFWCWDAGTSAATASTDGTNITPSNQWVNTAAGFSMSKYTGTGTKTDSIGHALGAKPEFVIIKDLVAGHSYPGWYVKHKDLTSGNNLKLESTAAQWPATGANAWFDGGIADLTSNTVVNFAEGQTTDSVNNVNKDDATYIMYAWTGIPGFSKFGKYDGNSAKPFVYLGFRPKLILIKGTTAGRNWIMVDSERFPHNGDMDPLYANSNGAEQNHNALDILSNGFKIVDDGYSDYNVDADLVYAAWAENPFKTARAR